MTDQHFSIKVQFKYSGEKRLIALHALVDQAVAFLEHYGEPGLVDTSFFKIIGRGDGTTRFKRLLKAAKYPDNAADFFIHLIKILEEKNNTVSGDIRINRLKMPYLFVLSILEVLIPGNRYIHIKSVQQLEKLCNLNIPEDKRGDLQRVIELFPVRLSMHTIRQMRISPAVAYQYMPFEDELNEDGSVHTWVGQFHRGIVEQMYQNRIIFVLNMACPVYCRFCFRKHKECRNQKPPTQDHVKSAVLYVKSMPDIKEIVLTGGDPFMNRATLTHAVDGLKEVPHVQTLRIATRSIAYYPHLFRANNDFWINYLKRKYLELESRDKRIEIATHFIHPDEATIESLEIIRELTQSGISVYVQTPLLNACNDQGPELVELYRKLRGVGAEMHYIYIPCSPIKGNRRFVSPISAGIEVARYLRGHVSDRAMPRICTATKIGKIDWNLSGWAVERDEDDQRYIWIRTPYTMDYFSAFAPILQLADSARVNREGTLDAKFMAEIGDDRLFWGEREPKSVQSIFPPQQQLTAEVFDQAKASLERLQVAAQQDQRFSESIVPTGSDSLFRTHRTRVELDLMAGTREMKYNLKYIESDDAISDVVISAGNDITSSFFALKELFARLQNMPHITAVRLRSNYFNYRPQVFSRALIHQLAQLNCLSVARPKRLEIETQFLHSSEFRPEHKELAGTLRRHGITVYNNTPLLPFINDSEQEMLNMANACRRSGIEFHHLYIAGLPLQLPWSDEYPVDISIIIDIASHLRRYESGRGMPRFIIRTDLGEVDFGLTSEMLKSDAEGRIFVKLFPYNLSYFQTFYKDFEWPKNMQVDQDGYPVLPVPGLKRTPEFFFD